MGVARGLTILLKTHDLNAVAAHLPWLICFNRGVIAQGRPEDVLTPDTLRAMYGSEMLVLRQHGSPLVANSPLAYRGCPPIASPAYSEWPWPSGRRLGYWGCLPVTTSTWPPALRSSLSAREYSPSPGS